MGGLFKRGALMIVTIVTIILIIVIGITIGGRAKVSELENVIGNLVSPVQKLLYHSGQFIESTVTPIFRFKAIDRENKELKKENEKLRKEMVEVYLTNNELEELRNLQNALNYVNTTTNHTYITASVVAKDTGNWFNIFTIDRGSNQGVIKDSTIMNGSGLIGKVFEVGDNWAKVITIIDNKSSVSFEILRKNEYIGVIRGSVEADLTGYLIDPDAEVLVGDKLITSGLSTYPKGIIIGEVTEVVKKKDELLKSITIEPAVNFKKLDKVLVLIANNQR